MDINATLGITLFQLINILLIMKINSHLNACNRSNSSRKWDFIEAFFAFIFGGIATFYILIEYSSEVFDFCTESKKKKKKEKDGELKTPSKD